MTDTLSLAMRVRALDDDELRAVIETRQLPAARIDDFFDLAEALLDPDSVRRTLAALDRGTLAVIAAAGETSQHPATTQAISERLAQWQGSTPDRLPARFQPPALEEHARRALDLMLLFSDETGYAPYAEVMAQLSTWPEQGLPDAAGLAAEPPPLPEASGRDSDAEDRLVTENAFSAVTTVTDLVDELAREPARRLQKGGLAAPEVKRVAEAMSIEPGQVASRLDVAGRAGLLGDGDGLEVATDKGAEWTRLRIAERWRALAAAWLVALPEDIAGILAASPDRAWGPGFAGLMTWLYPGADRAHDAAVLARDAETLGITVGGDPSGIGVLLLTAGPDAAAGALDERFPGDVDKVYLQHDLSIVSPGPLAPDLDARLRMIAHVESRALASTYRVTATSVSRAVAAGWTAGDILDFLTSISMTGVPQPLEYLVSEAAARYGRLRVRAAEPDETADGRPVVSWVHSDDPELIGTLAVDRSVAPLALVRTDASRLASRHGRDVVYWALSDAGYPAAAEDETGVVVTPPVRRPTTNGEGSPDRVADAIARLRTTPTGDEASVLAAWRARQIDAAIRAKDVLAVSVALPDGRTERYVLEPTGIAGGRLRARDPRADIERTLPLASIRDLKRSHQ